MSFPADLAEKAVASLTRLGVHVRTGVIVQDIDKHGVKIESHGNIDHLDSRTVIWAGGVTASPLGRTLASRTHAETDKQGRLKVNPDLTLPNFPDIYVIGDLALVQGPDGHPLPGVAQVAMQQGGGMPRSRSCAKQGGGPLPPFKYFDKGELAVIGRASAVAKVFGLHLWGLPAWIIWATVHLMYIVQFQSRVLVFIQWAIEDLTFSLGARLITGRAPTDFDFNHEVAGEESRQAD